MKRIDPLGWAILLITIFAAFAMFFTTGAYSEGNVAVNVASPAIEDASWGIVGEYERGIFEVEGNIQSGDTYTGNVDAVLTFRDSIGATGFRISLKNTFKGFSLNDIGRENDLGAAFIIPVGGVEVAAGIFGRNSNPFQPVYELEDPGDPTSAVITKDAGITIQGGSTVLGSLEAELDVGRFEIETQGLLELLGEGEKVQQLHANISTDGALLDTGFIWHASANVRLQKYGELVETEADYFLGIGKKF